MANFLTIRKFSNQSPGTFVDSDIYFYNNRKFSSLAPATWNLNDTYYYQQRKYGTFPDGEDFELNLPPVVDNPIPDQQATQGILFDFIFAEDTFSDPEAGALTYTATLDDDNPLPDWLNFNGPIRRFLGTPDNDDVDVILVKVRATDIHGASVTDTFQLEVLNVNDGPTVDQGISDQNAVTNIDFDFQFPSNAFEDIDGEVLTYTARLDNGDPLPNWLTFDSATRTFSGIPPDDSAGDLDIEVIATDGEG